jgi:hypothetical protein
LDDLRIGVIGVWTGVKVRYLVYELKTRMCFNNIVVCSQMTADRNPAAHDAALQHLRDVFKVRVMNIQDFTNWLADSPTASESLAKAGPGSVPAVVPPQEAATSVAEKLSKVLSRLDSMETKMDEMRQDVLRSLEFLEKDPDVVVLKLRRNLEAIVRDLFTTRIKQDPGTRPMEELIRTLRREKQIPRVVATHMNTVREIGNLGAHPLDPGERIGLDDVAPGLHAFVSIFEWVSAVGRFESRYN